MKFVERLVGRSDREVIANHINSVSAKLSASQGGHRLGMNTLIREVRTRRDADLGVVDREARLPDHRTGKILTCDDTLIDVLVQGMSIGLRPQLISQHLAGGNTTLEKLQGGINLREILCSF